MLIASLFVTTPNWKRSKYPPVGEWLNPLWYIHSPEQCSVMTRNRLVIDVTTWMDFKGTLFSGGKKSNLIWLPIIWFHVYDLKWQNNRSGEQVSGCQELGRGREKMVVSVTGILVIELFCIWPRSWSHRFSQEGNLHELNAHRLAHMHLHTHTHTHKCTSRWWNLNKVSGLFQHQLSGCDIVLKCCRVRPLKETGWRVYRLALLFLIAACESARIWR